MAAKFLSSAISTTNNTRRTQEFTFFTRSTSSSLPSILNFPSSILHSAAPRPFPSLCACLFPCLAAPIAFPALPPCLPALSADNSSADSDGHEAHHIHAHGGAFMATRPTLLSAIFAFASILTGSASAAEEQPQVQNAPFQFAGVVNADSVLVHSGPSDNYYITTKLAKGTPVTVVGIKFEWLKIVPPEGSFSVVAKNLVTRDANPTTGRINADNVNIRAGSSVVPLKITVQCKLPKGADVTIVGEDDAYYQIK